MQLEVEYPMDGVAVIKLVGIFFEDFYGTTDFSGEIEKCIEVKRTQVIIDLQNLGWVNAAGMGKLERGFHRLHDVGGRLVLANVPEKIEALFIATKLCVPSQTKGVTVGTESVQTV
jgi:anti-anti-sigma factor